MKNSLETHYITLTTLESQQVNGGENKLNTGFWYDLSYLAGAIVKGLVVFGTQGIRKACLCVK